MKKVVQKIILAGMVIKDNKILIIQRNANEEAYPNLWELPSGKREPFETSEDAVKREVKEETGLNVEPVMPVSVFEFKVEKPDEIRDATQINFLVKPAGDTQVVLSSEHQNFAWIAENELANYKLSKETQDTIKKVFKLIKNG